MALYGSQPFAGRVWAPGTKVSGINSPAEEWIVDPNLPPLGTDPRYPTSDMIVIPKGRLLAVRADSTSYTGKAVLTLANGSTNTPVGYTEVNIFREFQERTQWMPSVSKQEFIELPYVSTVNGAYGALSAGDKITAHFGSATSTTALVPNDKGKIVKHIPRTIYSVTQAVAALTMTLTNATLPAFTPRIVMAWNGTTVVSTGAVSQAFSSGNWVATFGQPVTTVIYDYGQTHSQVAGEVIRVEPISASHHLPGWLEWVTDNFLAWEYPPQLMRVPTTDVTNEVPTNVSTNYYTLANKPIAPWKTVTVTITGTVIAPDGTSTSVTGTALSVADLPMVDYTMGQYYNINPITGELFISNNVSITAITVSYSYETEYRNGRLYNQGLLGLTDGRYSGVPGTPASLEISGVVGSLRCLIY